MNDEERRELSQKLHKESQTLYDKGQNALCYVVIGSIFEVIGIIFIFLAMKRENNVMVGLAYDSLAFAIMVISLAGGTVLLVYGLVRLILSLKKRREVLRQINGLK